jgi:membrane associated rhomboid family serine protease
MFVPLHDDTPLRIIRFQWVTGAILIGNVVLFLMTGAFTSDAHLASIAMGYGVVPGELTGYFDSAFNPVPEPVTLITYMFLHAGWMHLISNMLFLWVFADNVEDAFGHAAFLLLYLLCGVAGALVHAIIMAKSPAPLIGASGAVSGILAAYLLLYPRARIWILFLMRIPLRISAIYVLGGWFLLQVVSLFLAIPDGVEVAWWAHIGGFIAGLLLTLILRSRLLIHRAG